VDWVLTTPLLLLGLLLIAMPRAGTPVDRPTVIAGVLGADVFMIATGFLAATSEGDAARWIFYTVSCIAFIAILATAWGPMARAADMAGTAPLYRRLLTVLTVLWLVYPILWVLGTEGIGVLGLVGEVWVFAVIDVSAKVLFGLLLVSGISSLPQRAAQRAMAAH
jgi:bacteriorhodopsin